MIIRPNSYKDKALKFLYRAKWGSIRHIKDYCYIINLSMHREMLNPLLQEGLIQKGRVEGLRIYGITEKGHKQVTGRKTRIKPQTKEYIYQLLLRNKVYLKERKANSRLEFLTHNEACGLRLMPARGEYVFYDGEKYYLMVLFVERFDLPENLNSILDRTAAGRLSYREVIHHVWWVVNDESHMDNLDRLTDGQGIKSDLYLIRSGIK